MGLAQRRMINDFQQNMFPEWKKQFDAVCGTEIPIEVKWDTLTEDDRTNADFCFDCWRKNYFSPLLKTFEAMGGGTFIAELGVFLKEFGAVLGEFDRPAAAASSPPRVAGAKRRPQRFPAPPRTGCPTGRGPDGRADEQRDAVTESQRQEHNNRQGRR